MSIAYFDCYSGISGDMTLGALVDLGLDIGALRKALRGLSVAGYSLKARRVIRCGISATKVDVELRKRNEPRRTFRDIKGLIQRSSLPQLAKQRAIEAFRKLAHAEATVHQSTVEKITFHEVGCTDAIVDIAGTMVGLEMLGIKHVYASALPIGGGTIRSHHGEYPVPAPATMELLKGVPIITTDTQAEVVTPTGAAIITTLAEQFGAFPTFRCTRIGYGAGTLELPGKTNFLRIMIGEEERARNLPYQKECLYLISTEIDDCNPELFTHVFDRLFALGCLDAHLMPIQMKKNRPGVTLEVLCGPEHLNVLIECIIRETTTFGVKVREVDRYCLRRRQATIRTDYGTVEVKEGYWGDELIRVTPEYRSCEALARSAGVPLLTIYNNALKQIELTYFHNKMRRTKRS
jgi:uncharacterized protein (TIGR00299 family) protein